jgi:hypothetical protein
MEGGGGSSGRGGGKSMETRAAEEQRGVSMFGVGTQSSSDAPELVPRYLRREITSD